MNHPELGQSEARRQYNEALVARHVDLLFRRLPMLLGFWLHPDLKVAEVVSTGTGYTGGRDLYDHVLASILQIAQECPEAAQLMRGRTFASAVH